MNARFVRKVLLTTQIIPIWLVALTGLLGACSGAGGGNTCLTSKDCLAAEVCVANICQGSGDPTGQSCTNNTDCGEQEFCDQATNTCQEIELANCRLDTDCPPHQRCQISLGLCVDGTRTCVDDSNCSGRYCDQNANICVECIENAHCPTGQECVASQCQDAGFPRCSLDSDCLPPQTVCESASCVAGCSSPGGLTCGAGTECNATTGRCDPVGNSCTNDSQCGAPVSVCEGNMCVAGCGQVGGLVCGANEVCDSNTGRCVNVPAPCIQDSECNPPQTVCEAGQCVGGCNQVGGVACTGSDVCNPSTGRCEMGNPPVTTCTQDSQCNPPQTICDQVTNMCAPSCLATGCPNGQMCNSSTGRCENQMNPPTGGAQLNANCTVNTDCASSSCFDFGPNLGKKCVQACGSSAECPANYTCYNYVGAKMCVASSLYTQATNINVSFAGNPGSPCLEFGQCKSGFCPQTSNMCVETCSEDNDCGGGYCRWNEAAPSTYIASCDGPQGSYPEGTTCSLDSQCASGACIGSVNTGVFKCAKLCRSSNSCTTNQVCRMIDYTLCAEELLGTCLRYQPNLVQTCVDGAHGNSPSGSSCTADNQCRSGFCDPTFNACSDLCNGDSDCGNGFRCKVLSAAVLIDGVTQSYLSACVPTSYN